MKSPRIFLSLLFVFIAVYDLLAQDRTITVRRAESVTGKKFAFLVGVTEYEYPNNFPTLTYTVRDVKALQKQLESIGFEPENIVVMASNTSVSRRPTKQRILTQLTELLKKVGENDIIVCVFSGHGAQIGKDQYFCPEDARLEDLADSCVPLHNVLGNLEKSSAKFKWMIVDACRNDPGKSLPGSVKSLGKVESVPKGVTAFFSCAETERSYEHVTLEHGIFTYFLLQGLAGQAADADGVVTILDLYKYVQKETRNFVEEKLKSTQIPYWSGEFTNFVIVQHQNGSGRMDFSKAKEMAEKGDAAAQNYLGVCYSRGTDDVRKNYSEAVKWYRRAAEQGFATAQFNLGVCYENGFGITKDLSEALKWYREAEKGGHERAKDARKRLEPPIDDQTGTLTTLKLPKPATVPAIPAGRQVKVSTVPKLLDAVENANEGDIIVLASGTYNLPETLRIGQSVVLYGNPVKPENVKLRNWHNNSNYATTLGTGRDANVKLIGLDISSLNGSGIYVGKDSSADIQFCRIYDCGGDGGGIVSPNGEKFVKISVEHCLITGHKGTGILTIGELTMKNCLIKGNGDGGLGGNENYSNVGPKTTVIAGCAIIQNGTYGIKVQTGNLTNCEITQNGLRGNGHGVYFQKGNVSNCIITHNGGGVLINANTLTNCEITQCEITQNEGTGINIPNYYYNQDVKGIKVTDCTIRDNGKHGVHVGYYVNAEFHNNTLRGNLAGNWNIEYRANITRIGNKPNE